MNEVLYYLLSAFIWKLQMEYSLSKPRLTNLSPISMVQVQILLMEMTITS